MNTKDKKQLWVCRAYSSKIKKEAAEAGLTVLEYTRKLAKDSRAFNEKIDKTFKFQF